MLQTAILDLGNPIDANAWESGCRSLSIGNAVEPVKTSRPTLQVLLRFVRSTPDWIFFSGHFISIELYTDGSKASLVFEHDQVSVTADDGAQVVRKGTATFGLDKQCKVVVWGGCSVCDDHEGGKHTVATLFQLLGPHVLLGFAGSAGAEITQALLGGNFIKTGHFFDNVRGKETDPTAIRQAWLQAGINGYKGGSGPIHRVPGDKAPINERLFRAVDPDGQEWFAEGGQIKRGRKMF